MRILLIHNFSRDTNGEDIYFLQLRKLLKLHNHQIVVYSKNNKNISDTLRNKAKIAGEMLRNKKTSSELTEIIKQFKPDISHIHNVYPLITPIAYQVCADNSVPIVQTIHNYRFICPKSFLFRDKKICELCVRKKFPYPAVKYKCYKNSYPSSFIFSASMFKYRTSLAFSKINMYIFPSIFTKQYFLNNYSDIGTQYKVIPYFVKQSKNIKYQKEKKNYFLYCGRLSEEKGILPLLDIFSALPNILLIIVGDGPLRDIKSKYLKYKNISFISFKEQKEVFTYMKNAIATIIPSLWYEVLPMVLIESLSVGTPVIVPKFGAFRNLVQDGKTGFFYEQYNFQDLKSKISYMYENRNKLEMTDLVNKEYADKYMAQIHYKKLIAVYKSLIKDTYVK